MADGFVNPLRLAQDVRLPRVAGPAAMVLFGVTGDLARKKLIPAIYDLANRGLLPPGFGLVGFGRRDWSDEHFSEQVHQAIISHARTPFRQEVWNQLAHSIRFVSGNFDEAEAFEKLKQTLADLDQNYGTNKNYAFYLSIPPKFFDTVVNQLASHGLAEQSDRYWRRVVIEKPFGHDLQSAKELNRSVSAFFPRESVFRIDHYLGKETVQNLLAFRFTNQLFEPVWNNKFVSHVQITMAEDIGIGSRAGYFDGIGIARDVMQNHLLQLMALVGMEEPNSFDANALRIEKQKLLAAAAIPERFDLHTARGQYCAGYQGGQQVNGYLDEEGISADSKTETYAATRIDINNRRWAGTPFYLRAAKRMPRRVTEVALVMKQAPHLPTDSQKLARIGNNALVLRIQPDEGITLRFGSKVPDTEMDVRNVSMEFNYGHSFTESSPEAYERLILDILLGDPPLFPQQEEVELSWAILDPLLDYWANQDEDLPQYLAGTWGPISAEKMITRDGFAWRRP